MSSHWSNTGASVLQFGPATDSGAGRLEGRVEHVASTRAAHFGSLDELLAAVKEMMAEANRTDRRPEYRTP